MWDHMNSQAFRKDLYGDKWQAIRTGPFTQQGVSLFDEQT